MALTSAIADILSGLKVPPIELVTAMLRLRANGMYRRSPETLQLGKKFRFHSPEQVSPFRSL